ncbi:MAG: hypothetical protein ABI414_03570, partial [Devosia sp.]
MSGLSAPPFGTAAPTQLVRLWPAHELQDFTGIPIKRWDNPAVAKSLERQQILFNALSIVGSGDVHQHLIVDLGLKQS